MKYVLGCLLMVVMAATVSAKNFKAADYGIAPGKAFTATDVARMLEAIRDAEEPSILTFEPGIYDVAVEQCQERKWFISNHDQVNPRKVFLPVEKIKRLIIKGDGAFFNLKGRILFAGIWDSKGITLDGITFDYETPTITQLEFLEVNLQQKTVKFRPIAGTQTEMQGTRLFFKGYGFRNSPGYGILFEKNGRIAYRTSDCPFNLGNVTDNKDGTFTAANCAHRAFAPGQFMAVRTWDRPAPGIVVSDSSDISVINTTVHFADGMGLIAQNTENLFLDAFKVVPNKQKGRMFTTQADATHFSSCWGDLVSNDGQYEGMMDDAINVHGTYLKVQRRVDDRTLECAYMHHQTFGINWGATGEKVTFVRSRMLQRIDGSDNRLAAVNKVNDKVLRLTFEKPLSSEVDPAKGALGIENLTRTPTVTFNNNIVKNNRARGALFSTPKKVLCNFNVFDHISGCAVLLCGDCNGWYETGACTDVTIAGNTFINALTSPFQFTEAVISIYPEIPELNKQTKTFHSGIVIEDNFFITFDKPLIYAKSVDGMTIRNNTLVRTEDYKPYLRLKDWLTLEKCENVTAESPVGLE